MIQRRPAKHVSVQGDLGHSAYFCDVFVVDYELCSFCAYSRDSFGTKGPSNRGILLFSRLFKGFFVHFTVLILFIVVRLLESALRALLGASPIWRDYKHLRQTSFVIPCTFSWSQAMISFQRKGISKSKGLSNVDYELAQ